MKQQRMVPKNTTRLMKIVNKEKNSPDNRLKKIQRIHKRQSLKNPEKET